MPFKQGNIATRLLYSLVVSLLLLGSSTAHAKEPTRTGEFYADSMPAKSGEVWLGLYQVGDEYELLFVLVCREALRRKAISTRAIEGNRRSIEHIKECKGSD